MGMRSDSYYTAARERIKEARFLHESRYYTLAMYVSGLAVECMLRAFRLLRDPTFDERHDLWRLWKSTELANVRGEFYHEKVQSAMDTTMSLWRNDYRFRSEAVLRAYLKKIGSDRGIKGDFLKFNSKTLYEAAEEIVQFGVNRWKLLNKK
jgi:hypothetical protein